MAEYDDSKSIPKPWVMKKSKRKANLPYYFNLETHETSWTHPGMDNKQTEKETMTPVIVEAQPVIHKRKIEINERSLIKKKRIGKACSSEEPSISEPALKICDIPPLSDITSKTEEIGSPQRKRKKYQRKENDAVLEKVDVLKPKDCKAQEGVVVLSSDNQSLSDDVCTAVMSKKTKFNSGPKNVTEDGCEEIVYKPVNLCEPKRKPVKFTVSDRTKSKFLEDLKTNSLKPSDTPKTKSTVHPSIMAFKKLAKTVKWSKPLSTASKKGSSADSLASENKDLISETKNYVEKKSSDHIPRAKKEINSLSLNEKSKSVSNSKLKEQNKHKEYYNTSVAKRLVPLSYGFSDDTDEEDSEGLDKESIVAKVSRQTFTKGRNLSVSASSSYTLKKRTLFIDLVDEDSKHDHEKTENSMGSKDVQQTVKILQQRKKPQFIDVVKNSENVHDLNSESNIGSKDVQHTIGNFQQSKPSFIDAIDAIAKISKDDCVGNSESSIESKDVQHTIENKVCHTLQGESSAEEMRNDTSCLDVDFDRNMNSVYYVVDTNVLLHHVKFLEDFRRRRLDGKNVVIVVPYIVLQELDGLKKNKTVEKASQDAICWCNRYFERKDATVVGQTYDNYRKSVKDNPHNSPDDLIRDYCQLIKQQNLNVTLLTNDVNLRNKSHLSFISAISVHKLKNLLERENRGTPCSEDFDEDEEDVSIVNCRSPRSGNSPERMVVTYSPPEKHQVRRLSSDHLPKEKDFTNRSECNRVNIETSINYIIISVRKTLGDILEAAFIDSYGDDLWEKIIIHKPPWTLDQIFKCWDKHWIAVFNDKFPRQTKNFVGELSYLSKGTNEAKDVKSIQRKIERLYKIFEGTPYRKHVVPVGPKILQDSDCDMNEAKPVSQESESFDPTCDHPRHDGLSNLKEMINLVGMYITHFMAMIFDGCGVTHELSRINNDQITQEDAQSSAVNLHTVIMKLGISLVGCVESTTPDKLQEFGMLLIKFWDDAKQPCPNLPFTSEDLMQFITTLESRKFLEMVAGELERLLFMLTDVLKLWGWVPS